MTSILRKPFHFARHGTTDWNVLQLCQGHTDIPLNEAGRKEAAALAQKAASFNFSHLYTSPLRRALETASIVQQTLSNSQLILVDELKERHWGQLEGISSLEMYRIEEIEESNPSFNPGRGVEIRDCFKVRIAKGLNRCLANDEKPLIIAHGRLFLVLCELLQIPLVRQIPNASLIHCIPAHGTWTVNLIGSNR